MLVIIKLEQMSYSCVSYCCVSFYCGGRVESGHWTQVSFMVNTFVRLLFQPLVGPAGWIYVSEIV